MDVQVTSVLTSLLTSGAIVSLAIWFSKEWISTRLKSSIQHEYDQKLESIKAKLKEQNEVALVELQAAIERHNNLLTAAHSSFAEGQKAAMERKLQAIDTLWERVLQLRERLPPLLGFIDFLTVDDYKKNKDHPMFIDLSERWSVEKISTLVDSQTERVRPYVGEYTWAVFFSYQAVMLRIVFLLHAGHTDTEKLEWHKDTGTRQLLQAVLSTTELEEFDDTAFGKILWLQRRLESKILGAARQIISGKEFGAVALEQAKLIQERAVLLTSKKTL